MLFDQLVTKIQTYESDTFNAFAVNLNRKTAQEIAEKVLNCMWAEVDGVLLSNLFDEITTENEEFSPLEREYEFIIRKAGYVPKTQDITVMAVDEQEARYKVWEQISEEDKENLLSIKLEGID